MIEEEEDADVDVFDRSRQGAPVATDRNWIRLPSAHLLSVSDADLLLRWRPATIVAVVGERNGGKTTLITEIYERFLRGPFADQLFSYSQTLLGFEQKSHQSRASSRIAKPDTPRTSANEGLRFFHLSLVAEEGACRTDLLISERAGETYREARDRPAESKTLEELSKARMLVFILDGERVAADKMRAEAFASVRSSIRAFSDAGAIPKHATVQLVTTKFDLLGKMDPTALTALEEFEGRLVKSYEDRFAQISCWRTAARDPTGRLDPAWGVDTLLKSWLAPPRTQLAAAAPLPELHDEFDRLVLRRARSS